MVKAWLIFASVWCVFMTSTVLNADDSIFPPAGTLWSVSLHQRRKPRDLHHLVIPPSFLCFSSMHVSHVSLKLKQCDVDQELSGVLVGYHYRSLLHTFQTILIVHYRCTECTEIFFSATEL